MKLLQKWMDLKKSVQTAATGSTTGSVTKYNHPETIQNTAVDNSAKLIDFMAELSDIINSYDTSKMSAIAQSFKEITDWKEDKITAFTQEGLATEYLIGEMEKERTRYNQELNDFYANAGEMDAATYVTTLEQIRDKSQENAKAISLENAEFFSKIEEAYTVKLQELVDSVLKEGAGTKISEFISTMFTPFENALAKVDTEINQITSDLDELVGLIAADEGFQGDIDVIEDYKNKL